MGAPAATLTSLAGGAGCGCKLGAAELLPIVRGLPAAGDERVLVGSATGDDAGVFRIDEQRALVQSVDFFTPLVDDPYDFGRIAAANALSDIYAMGATPLTALNLVAFPLRQLGGETLRAILRGGLDVATQAGVAILGGHSIDDAEPKYGMAVTGVVDPERVVTNAGGQPGDALVLTKPLGTGAIVAAAKRGVREPALLSRAVATMVTLNAGAAAAALQAGVHAMTDVTGFGLLGHLHNLCRESGLSAELRAADVPALGGVRELLQSGEGASGGSRRNAEWAESFASFDEEVQEWQRRLVCDPTTSGGLLVALPASGVERLPGVVVGELVEGPAGSVCVRA
ncbi:MAG: selenide, water dikinase SelD [Solirubrobacteraceae bacterium]